ncbi:MAG: sensor histidine kinase [Anaerolineae bacterium]|nr:sensor histidine kinase [Anaerolineae bacterium]
MGRSIEPGLLYIFRYFSGIAMIYFAIMWGYGITAPSYEVPLQVQSLMNLATNSCLFAYLSIPWLERRLRSWYLPFAIVAYTGVTVFSNLIYFFEPGADVYTIIARSWALVPILLVPLVLIAWQYSFVYVLAFTVLTNAIELFFLILVVERVSFEALPILGQPLIRAFAFGTVGYIVERLMDTQRKQKRRLIMTNIQLGQYANTLEHLATSRERNRLARELHDTLAHTLSGVAVNLEAIKTMLAPDQGDVSTMLDHSLSATRLGLEETRRVLQDLRARPLEDLGLELALRALVQALADREDIEAEIAFSGDLPTLSPDVEQSIYRITQEALENIARHADARHTSLSLKAAGNQIELTITDDGSGFDPKSALDNNHQLGLRGLRERAAVAGGVLSVNSRQGGGTTIRFTWEKLDVQDPDL